MNGVISGNMVGGGAAPLKTVILEDENGNEVVGVVVDNPVVFTANAATDIREGKVAATDAGVVIGSKVIPAYETTTGVAAIFPGDEFKFTLKERDKYDYTELQAMIMPWNTSYDNSVAVEKAIIENNVYNVGSTTVIATVTKDAENKAISLGIVNGETPAIIRYFTYKEESSWE